jgi:hypothetical protein
MGAILAVLAIFLGQAFWSVFLRQNDFEWHYNVGTAFLAGDPYGRNSDHYPLGRTMFNGALAMLPLRWARLTVFLIAAAGLAWSCSKWRNLGIGKPRSVAPIDTAAMVAALAILAPYVMRDLDECGLQLLVLLMLTAAAVALSRGLAWRAGLWLALATAYKATPLLFLPFLLWKRQWRAAAAMVVFGIAINLLPAVWLGWDKMVSCNAQWLARARYAAAQGPSDSPILYCPPQPRNFALQVALARYLEDFYYPPESLFPQDHPGYVNFGWLEPAAASMVVKSILLVMAAALAWRFRRPWTTPGTGDAVARPCDSFAIEWAVVTLLCALLSPFCWKQHLVLALPCLFLVIQDLFYRERLPRMRLAALALIAALVIFTKRFPWGQELSIVVASYKPDTIAMLLTVLLTLTPLQRGPRLPLADASPRRTAKGAPHGPDHARHALDPVAPAGVHAA